MFMTASERGLSLSLSCTASSVLESVILTSCWSLEERYTHAVHERVITVTLKIRAAFLFKTSYCRDKRDNWLQKESNNTSLLYRYVSISDIQRTVSKTVWKIPVHRYTVNRYASLIDGRINRRVSAWAGYGAKWWKWCTVTPEKKLKLCWSVSYLAAPT